MKIFLKSCPLLCFHKVFEWSKILNFLPAVDEAFEPLRRSVAFWILDAKCNELVASRFLLDLRPVKLLVELVDIAVIIILSIVDTVPNFLLRKLGTESGLVSIMPIVVVLLRSDTTVLLRCSGGITKEVVKKCIIR